MSRPTIPTSPRVGVALLNWNSYTDTCRCLSSLRRSSFQPAQVSLLDNGSNDGSGPRLKKNFPEIHLLSVPKNCGFAEGNNRIAKVLLNAGMDYLWILNNDTKIAPDCLHHLVSTLERDPSIGAVAPKIYYMHDPHPLLYAGGTYNRSTFRVRFRGSRMPDAGQYNVPQDTEILPGCSMLIRADVIRKIGLFNQTLFTYCEDTDWSIRAVEAGIRLRYQPSAIMWHKTYGSTVKNQRDMPKSSPKTEFFLARNNLLLIKLHTPPRSFHRFSAMCRFIIRRLERALALLLIPGRQKAALALLHGLIIGSFQHISPENARV